jgi:hypothetical protein
MSTTFTQANADAIARILGAEKISLLKDHYRIKVVNTEDKRSLVLEIFPETTLGSTRGMLVVVYAGNAHLQLHNCSGFVMSEELGEVTFVSEVAGKLSGLVVEAGAACSLYASINRELISTDFTQLGVEVMLSGVALSLAEEVLSPESKKKTG